MTRNSNKYITIIKYIINNRVSRMHFALAIRHQIWRIDKKRIAMTFSLKLWRTDAFLSHVAILSTMYPFEGSLKCIAKHCPTVKNFLRRAIKVRSLVYRRNHHHDPHPVVQQRSPLRFAAYRAAFFEVGELAKSDLPRSWQHPHRISSSPARIGQALCATHMAWKTTMPTAVHGRPSKGAHICRPFPIIISVMS